MQFTIHFATINTEFRMNFVFDKYEFTIHFATINTWNKCLMCHSIHHLQYTLLLLIHYHAMLFGVTRKQFTIHFATINTEKIDKFVGNSFDLQYTLLLLIHTGNC